MRLEHNLNRSLNATSGNVSYSTAQDISGCVWICGDAVWTTTGTGSIALQISNDKTNWYDMTSSPVSITGNSSAIWTPTFGLGALYIRFRLTSTSGAIAATFNLVAKGL